jgi:hypothetical protein
MPLTLILVQRPPLPGQGTPSALSAAAMSGAAGLAQRA